MLYSYLIALWNYESIVYQESEQQWSWSWRIGLILDHQALQHQTLW